MISVSLLTIVLMQTSIFVLLAWVYVLDKSVKESTKANGDYCNRLRKLEECTVNLKQSSMPEV